jgi:hypothetical protein
MLTFLCCFLLFIIIDSLVIVRASVEPCFMSEKHRQTVIKFVSGSLGVTLVYANDVFCVG